MGADTARHYQWYPWHNAGHYETWSRAGAAGRAELARYYREGLERVARRATNGFRVGIPFIWCSNDLMVSFATQARLLPPHDGRHAVRRAGAGGDRLAVRREPVGHVDGDRHAARRRVRRAIRTRSCPTRSRTASPAGWWTVRCIARSTRTFAASACIEPDEYAAFNTGRIVYHDDLGDYSTNEHIMDGTASLAYLLATLDPSFRAERRR